VLHPRRNESSINKKFWRSLSFKCVSVWWGYNSYFQLLHIPRSICQTQPTIFTSLSRMNCWHGYKTVFHIWCLWSISIPNFTCLAPLIH
jgi:hypothetical protein